MLHKIGNEERKNTAHLFHGIEDSMVIAYLQGYMGDAYVDKYPEPTAGMIISGEYTFFGGDPNSSAAQELVINLFRVNPSKETVGIFGDDNPEWENTLLSIVDNHPVAVPRYGIVQKDYQFDEKSLKSIIDSLPDEYRLRKFDKGLYEQAMAEEWSKEFCETFSSVDDYLTRGFGYGVVCEKKMVAGTSTMTVYDGGTEIQVATHPDHRQKGLAMPSAAAFILECVQRKIRPCWDAANEISLKMALKLGYEYKGIYTTIHMHA